MTQLGLSPAHFAVAFPFHFIFDRDLKIVQAGPMLCRLLGGDPTGDLLTDRFRLEQPSRVQCTYEAFEKKQKSLFILRCGDNVRLRGQLCVDAERELVFFIGSPWLETALEARSQGLSLNDFALHDPITDFLFTVNTVRTALADARSSEARLTAKNKQLHDVLADKERYQQELERSNVELEKFAYVASHDLKAPLRGMVNLAEWVEEDAEESLSDASRKHLRMLRGRAQRLEAMLTGLLEYAQIKRSSDPAEKVELAGLISSITELLAPGDGFEVRYEGELDSIETQATPLRQVLLNLIANAITHHDEDSGVVTVRANKSGNDAFEFTVADDGPGISPAFHAQIFQLFSTLKRRDEVDTSGIGLALIKRVVEIRGGCITVESGGGRGSTFRVRWPLAPSVAAARDARVPAEAEPQPA